MLGRIDGVMRLAQCSSDRGVIHNVENMNGLSVVSEIANQYGNGDVVTAPAEGNGNGINGNPIRCYNCRGEGHYASNCTVKSRKHNAAYLQQSYRLLVAQEDEARDLKGTQGNLRSWTTADAHEEQERMDQLRSIWFAAQLEISKLQLRVKSSDTQCASNTIDLVSQKLEDENVSLEFQVRSYAKENEHLNTSYKNYMEFCQSIHKLRTISIIESLQKQLYDTIYENAKLRAQLFDKVSEPKGTTKGTRTNTRFTKQSILGKPPSSSYKLKLYSVTPFPKSSVLPKVDKTNALSKPVTSNSAPAIRESKVVQTVNVIAPRIFKTNPSKTSRVDNVVPNKPVKTSVRIKPITVS
ncbi:reverse transcriptase domain-containing protein [Tanacetum coccineum]|uniref:Reverse transcriptase domain-containing protein n=1 Tax=Tanacetum coccineum TaxID=301880 RepID=A0ABQ5FSW2_9ASTR